MKFIFSTSFISRRHDTSEIIRLCRDFVSVGKISYLPLEEFLWELICFKFACKFKEINGNYYDIVFKYHRNFSCLCKIDIGSNGILII